MEFVSISQFYDEKEKNKFLIILLHKQNLPLRCGGPTCEQMELIDELKALIGGGEVDAAIEQIDHLLSEASSDDGKDVLYYLKGNAYRKKGDWKRALDNYQYAVDINPQSPAAQAREMVIDILNFYNKDMYNQ